MDNSPALSFGHLVLKKYAILVQRLGLAVIAIHYFTVHVSTEEQWWRRFWVHMAATAGWGLFIVLLAVIATAWNIYQRRKKKSGY